MTAKNVWVLLVLALTSIAGRSQDQGQIAAGENKNERCRVLNEKAYQAWDNDQLDLAVDYFTQSLALYHEIGNQNAIATINSSLGMICSQQEKYLKAADHFASALETRRKMGDKKGTVSEIINLAIVRQDQDDYEGAVGYLDEALAMAREQNDIRLLRTCYSMLAENHQNLGNAEQSLEYFNYYSSLEKKIQKDQLAELEEEVHNKLGEVEKKNAAQEKALKNQERQLDKLQTIGKAKQLEIELLNKEKRLKEMTLKEQQARIENETQLKNSFLIGLLLVGMFAFVAVRGLLANKKINAKLSQRNKDIELQNEEIEKQKKELLEQKDSITAKSDALQGALNELKLKSLNITSSINYAKRIQEAFLPKIETIRKSLPESFIYFNPRDLVSGDFYWFKHVEAVDDDFFSIKEKIIITSVDCTGHGVPGAFMSLIGIELLNQIVNLKGITAADRILNELHTQVRLSLNQESNENKDGMDMGLCVYHLAEKRLDFAGAKNPIVYIQDNELNYIKGNKMPIGGLQKEEKREFTTHSITIDKPTWVYLFSDGIQDQFGGPQKRKFMIGRLKNLLLDIHQKPMEEQKEMIETTINDWKKEEKQIDDMLIIGFKLT